VIAIVAGVFLIGAAWLLLVSPERGKVTSLTSQIATETAALTQAQAQLDSARGSVASYVDHIHVIDTAMRAVPSTPAEAALIRTIVKLAGTKVDFNQLDVGGGAASSAGPISMGLNFTFNANYGNLQNFLASIDALTTTDGTNIYSKGRLFTIQSVSLTPQGNGSTKASIVASVYQQDPSIAAAGATGATGATGGTP
jgi:hypothetical protein